MPTLKLRIQQKGVLVVAIPFIVQVVCVTVLLGELRLARIEGEKEAHATVILGLTNDLRRLTEEACMDLVLFKKERNESRLEDYDRTVKAAERCIRELSRQTDSDEEDKAEVHKIDKVFGKTISILEECKLNLIEGNTFASLSSISQLFMAGIAVKDGVDRLSQKYHHADAERTRGEKRRNEILEATTLGGLLADVVLAFVLMAYMSKSVTGRLQTLAENSRRLAEGKELLPALYEEDEISDLDTDFRTMADKLIQAQKELHEMTETALENEANVRSIIENMPLGVLIVNETDQIILVNPRLEQMFGYTRDEMFGKSLQELVPSVSDKRADKRTNEVRIGMAAVKVNESVARNRAGESFFVEVSVNKFSDAKGKSYLVIIQDVTERHEMERLKREFVAMVSHDLRTPLAAVQATLDLLMEGAYGELTATGEKRVRVASDSVDRLIGLINDLLDIEKMEAGKMQMELKPVNLDKVLSHCIESVRTYAENSQITLEYRPVHIGVLADSDRLIQVVVNFLSNAVKFSEPGGKVILEAEKLGDQAEVRVIDYGRGIPSTHLDSMFQRFKQVRATDGARKKGTGLGLAISKAIIENHNGEIGVSSVEGKGSTFFFRVPLVEC